ncbi:MAG: hypothetical protein AAGU27_21915 [Dehalobacterium sp.]
MINFKPNGLATGLGSLPHQEPDEAVKFVLSYFPEMPYWPQLPTRSDAEGFLIQCIAPLIKTGLVVNQDGRYVLDTEQKDWVPKLTEFYEICLAALDGDDVALSFFNYPKESASGFYAFLHHLEHNGVGEAQFLKGQISGPTTVGLALTDQNRKPLYYHPQGRDVLLKTLTIQALIQAKVLGQFGLPVVIFVDDPSLSAFGKSTYITIKKEELLSELNNIYDVIKQAGALAGTHSCAAMDWSILFDSEVDIVSFDAYNFFLSMTSYVDGIQSFINRGGVLAWGIVPTEIKNANDFTAANLGNRLQENIEDIVSRGVDGKRLREQSMITPSCGTGTLPMESAIQIHKLTKEISRSFWG